MSAAPGGAEAELIVNAGYESVAFLICPTFLRFHLETRQLDSEIRIPEGIQLLTPEATNVRRLFLWGRSLTQIASRQLDLFDKPETKTSAQGEMVELLLEVLKSAVLHPATKSELTRERHSTIVQAAENYVLSHPSGQLYLTDLCKATGVSVRTLQYAFQEVMGMTPVAYLTKLRLHRVRQSLRLADHASTTVSQEATRWGFWHFGDFSRAYKDCFGELPSDTLRRPPDAGESR
jgi:transcriptional regulator GlxA family with amidase domain